MRRFISSMILFVIFSAIATVTTSLVFAAPGLSVSPASPKAYQAVTFTASGCPPNSVVIFSWRPPGEAMNSSNPNPLAKTDGTATYSITAGFSKTGTYAAGVECGGQTYYNGSAFIVEATAATSIVLDDNGAGKLQIDGCPPNSEAIIEWAKYVIWDTGYIPGDATVQIDAQGNGEYQFTDQARYELTVACGGAVSNIYELQFGEEDVTPTPLPPPPSPACKTFTDGRCTVVNTAIGEINTDGIGIIYSIYTVILSISGGIMVLTIIYAGFLLMTSRGNPDQIQRGREMLMSAIIGFLFIIFSYVIFGILTSDILKLPGFSSTSSPTRPRPGNPF